MFLILSFFIGVSIVMNMVLNGKLSQGHGMINGVLIHYFMATISSLILCAVMIQSMPSYSILRSIPLPYFMGGVIGVLTTYFFNIIVSKVPAGSIVILRFVGQIFTSAIIDYIYLHLFSIGKIIGGTLFLVGLILNGRVDRKIEHTDKQAREIT